MRYQKTILQKIYSLCGNLCFLAALASAWILMMAILDMNRSLDALIILSGFALYFTAIIFKELSRVRIPKY